ncbi:MAG: cardiolipin synthase ClsB [Caldimonas sp.]
MRRGHARTDASPLSARAQRTARPAPMPRAMRPDHGLTLLKGGDDLFPALVVAIDAARSEVLLETYIFDFAGSPLKVAEALERAAARGVAVRIVVDGFGTGDIAPEWQQRWKAAGLQWRVFNPARGWRLLLPKRWRRLHRKLCVVDRRTAFCGGINLVDDRFDPNYGKLDKPRFDFAVRVTGPLVADIHDTMTRLWLRLEVGREARQHDLEGTARALRAASRAGTDSADARIGTAARTGAGAIAALVLRDNFRYRRRIEATYRLAIAQAKSEILIANAYFIPGVRLQRALLRAAARGVRITLLLQGRYEYFLQHHASRAVYGALLDGGIEIIEYEPSFLHAKVAVMDTALGSIATVGSSNLDPLSMLLAREANVFVLDAAFGAELRGHLMDAIAHEGHRVESDAYRKRPLRTRWLAWLAYALIQFALYATGKRY